MKHLILVSHGSFAAGLKTSLSMFARDRIGQVTAVGLADGMSVDDLSAEFSRQLDEEIPEDAELVVLADIVGGSPLTTVCRVLGERGRLDQAVVLGGMNLPMALNALVMMDVLPRKDLVSTVLNESVSAVREFSVSSDDDDDDDDI